MCHFLFDLLNLIKFSCEEEVSDMTIQSCTEETEHIFPPEKKKVLIGLIILISGFGSSLGVLPFVHERVPDQGDFPPLSDASLDLLPENDIALTVCELMISVGTAALLLSILIFHTHRFIVLRRLFIITGILYFFRSVAMFVTVLPVSTTKKYCAPKLNGTNVSEKLKRALKLASGFGLSYHGKQNLCGDIIYSGHTVILCMISLAIAEYTPPKFYYIHWISWILTCTGIFMLLWSHAHYTIDVIIAYYFTTRLFWMYHTFANNAKFRRKIHGNDLTKVWWFPFLKYLEKNITAPVPHHYELPFDLYRKYLNRRAN